MSHARTLRPLRFLSYSGSGNHTHNAFQMQMGTVNNTHNRIHQRGYNLQIFGGKVLMGNLLFILSANNDFSLDKKRCRGYG